MNAIRISTRNYENSTGGQKPKPSQNGFWNFDLTGPTGFTQFFGFGEYRDLLNQAQAAAREFGADTVAVCP